MKDIVKMTLYEFWKNSIIRTLFVTTFLCEIVLFLFYHAMEPDKTLIAMLNDTGTFTVMVVFIGVAIACFVAATVSGSDFKDKTMNYDLMFGHSRKQAYWGRVLPALSIGAVLSTIAMVVPFIIILLVMEPGEGVDWLGILFRVALLEVVILRMSCEIILLTFLLRNVEYALLVYFGAVLGVSFLTEQASYCSHYLFGMDNIGEALDWIATRTYRLDEVVVTIYQYMPTGEVVWKTLLSSLLLGGACLILGYLAFKKDDMK